MTFGPEGEQFKLVEVLVGDEVVGMLPATGASYEMRVEGMSRLTVTVLADDVVAHSRSGIR